MSWII